MKFLEAVRPNPKAKPRSKSKSGAKKTGAMSKRARRTMHPAARKALIAGAALLLTAGLGYGGLWLLSDGDVDGFVERKIDNTTASLGLSIQDVLVDGRNRTAAEDVLAALEAERGKAIFAVDPEATRAALEALPWVKRAEVRRQLPDVLYVRLTEREPMAIWQLRGRLSVIDQDGEEIPDIEAARFADLPLVVGEGAPAHTAELLEMLARQPGLRGAVTAAVRVSDRRWNLRLTGGIDVQLPEEAAAEAWDQLAHLEQEHQLLSKDVVLIDLRLPDRMIVRTANGQETTEQTPERAQPISGSGEDA